MKTIGKPQSDSDVVNKEPKVLLIGFGWVGQFMGGLFTQADYVTSDGIVRNREGKPVVEATTIDDWGNFIHYDLAIIGVPTPMNPETGQCDTSYVEAVVKKYKPIVETFLIKSTVEIGTTDRLKDTYGVKIGMSPEYVGETLGHPLTEPKRDVFQIIGAERETAEKIADMFRLVLTAQAPILICTAKEAEIIKYCENLWIMQRVDYWNDVMDICQTLNASFTQVREGLVLDPRFSRTHSNVYQNNRGWSGKCLPKDMNGLVYTMRKAGNPLKTIELQIEKNATKWRGKYTNSVKLIPDKPAWK